MWEIVLLLMISLQSFTNGKRFLDKRNEDKYIGEGLDVKNRIQDTEGLGIVIFKNDMKTEMNKALNAFKTYEAGRQSKPFGPDTEHKAKGKSSQWLGRLVISGKNTMDTDLDTVNAILLDEGLDVKSRIQDTEGLGIVIFKNDMKTEMNEALNAFKAYEAGRQSKPFGTDREVHKAKGKSSQGLGRFVISGENTMDTDLDTGNAILLDEGLDVKIQIQDTEGLGIVIFKNDMNTEMNEALNAFKAYETGRQSKPFGPDTEHKATGKSRQGLGRSVISGENTVETDLDTGNAILLDDHQKNIKLRMPRNESFSNNVIKKRFHGIIKSAPAHNIRHWFSRGHKVFDSLVSRIQTI